MNFILLTLLSACTPWKGHRDIATVETPIEASLVQSEFRFFTIEGTKVIAFPIFGCSAKIELFKDEHTFQVDYIKGNGGMIQSCPSTRTGELLSSPDGKYLAVNINSEWQILQSTPQGLFPVSTPTGFTGSASDWNGIRDVSENPADLLLYQDGSWNNQSTIMFNTLELVKTQSSSEQREFLSQTVETIPSVYWTELYAGLEPTDQTGLVDELINVFLEETSNVDVDNSIYNSKKHTALRKILVPLVNANDHIEFLTRLMEHQDFQSDEEFATVYAKVWTVDPALSGKQACLHITADPRRGYHSTQRKSDIALFTLASKTSCEALPSVFEDAELKPCCDDDCTWNSTLPPIHTLIEGPLIEDTERPSLNTVYRYYLEYQGNQSQGTQSQDLDKFNLAHLRSKYVVDQQESTDCVGVYEQGVSCVAPEENIQETACLQTIDSSVSPIDYIFTVNDDDQTIQNIQSTGKLTEPTAVIVPMSGFWTKSTVHTKEQNVPEQKEDEQKEDEQNITESDIGYSCSLEGTFPFYGKLNKVTAEWTVNGTVVEIKEDTVDKLIDYLGRTLSSPKLEGYSSNSFIKNTVYNSGDTLGCTLKVTKATKTSLDTIVKTKGLGISRNYTAESIAVP